MRNKLSSPFPFYLGDERKNFILILCFSTFLFCFLAGVHTSDLSSQHGKVTLLGKISMIAGITFLVMFISIIVVPRLFSNYFDSGNWTLGKYLTFNFWQLILVGTISTALLYGLDFYPNQNFWEIALQFFPRMLLYGIGPMIIVTLILNTKMLNENLRTAIHANQMIERLQMVRRDAAQEAPSLTIFSDTSETLTLKLPDLLFVEADDNYSTFYWTNGKKLEKKMLRLNLKNVETQLDNSFTMRCHRSYIVNINMIHHVTGNANGYKLTMKDTDLTVPVSRSKGKEVIEKIEHLRNSLEIA